MTTHGPLCATPAVADAAGAVPVIMVVAASAFADRFAAALGSDYAVSVAPDLRHALQSVPALQPDLIFVDAAVIRSTGDESMAELRMPSNVDATPVVVIAPVANDETRLTWAPADEHPTVTKAWRLKDLPAWIAGALAERRHARTRLHESERRLAGIIESAMDAIISVDEHQCICMFNRAAAQMFGLDAADAIGQPLERLIPERFRISHRDHVGTFAQTGVTARRMGALREISALRANGDEFLVEASISHTDVAGAQLSTVILRDITPRRQAELALGQLRGEMDEMLALHVASQTAASIAHELNQPLNAIATYCETAARLVRAGNPKPDRLLRALERSTDQSQRAAQVARELIEFLHRGESPPEAVDLNDAAMRALSIVESNGFGGFRAVVDLAPKLKPVLANRLHVEKILVNLLRNGVEAMRGAGVRTQAITITIRTAAGDRDAQVTVHDTGPGLDAETARRVFEPFFTTKKKGIGMGLAISRALVEAHGGRLWVDLDGAPGAAFHLTLPFVQ